MDNPGTSLFQGTDININNSQNHEEEEDLEDQIRRREELQNLLTAALDDFKYDDSTINSSSNVSIASMEDIHNNYKEAAPNDQLKILYDVRVREINNLKEEYNKYKIDKSKEIDNLKKKLVLSEADIHQLQVSLKNSESLLVEKTDTINGLNKLLKSKDDEINSFKQIIDQYEFEVNRYKSTVQELQLKLSVENHPFNLGGRIFKSDEVQKANQEQILKLESLLEEQIKQTEYLLKEKEELKKLIESRNIAEHEHENAIHALSQTLESAQNQCKDLLDVIEELSKENAHFKERMKSLELTELASQDTLRTTNFSDTQSSQNQQEKLKRMLVDKSMEVNTLRTKQKFYESDVKELIEYRNLKADMCKVDFKQCENMEHNRYLLLMQNDLQNYRKIVEDKEQQIINLNTINKELQEKIQEMLMQTRTEIKNLSHKYSLPQLESMSEELKLAEEKVAELEEKLKISEENRVPLLKDDQILREKFKKSENELKNVQKMLDEEKQKLDQLQKSMDESDVQIFKLQQNITNLKQSEYEVKKENNALKTELEELKLKLKNPVSIDLDSKESISIKTEYNQIKQQLAQVMDHLQKSKNNSIQSSKSDSSSGEKTDNFQEQLIEAKNEIDRLKDTIEDINSAKTIAEGEKYSLEFQLKDCQSHLDRVQNEVKELQKQLSIMKSEIQEKEGIIKTIKANSNEVLLYQSEIEKLRKQKSENEQVIKICEEDKADLSELLQEMKTQLEQAKAEIMRLQKDLSETRESVVRRNLEKELKEAENELEQSKMEEKETEHFKKTLQAELLKSELEIRESIKNEFTQKIRDIESKYQKIFNETNDLYKDQLQKLKSQETRCRQHLANVLAECAKKVTELETENGELINQLGMLENEYAAYKKEVIIKEDEYRSVVNKTKIDAQNQIEVWRKWAKDFVNSSLNIEAINKKSRDKICSAMSSYDAQAAAIEKAYNEKIKLYLRNECM